MDNAIQLILIPMSHWQKDFFRRIRLGFALPAKPNEVTHHNKCVSA